MQGHIKRTIQIVYNAIELNVIAYVLNFIAGRADTILTFIWWIRYDCALHQK